VDFSKRAVETMRAAEDYATIAEGRDERKGSMRAEVWDVAGEDLPEGMEESMADVVIMIFIFSALSPRQWARAVRNVCRVLKPGGEVLFRDYGRGDLAQVRFKAGRWMEENFYVRGDGTRVYFFEKEELESIWTGEYWSSDLYNQPHRNGDKVQGTNETKAGDNMAQGPNTNAGDEILEGPVAQFDILNLDVDRRLIVNRQRRIKMYRCWLQGRFKKPPSS
jgi:tRNAThr (cytosine32-N3)-methyltransferase